MTKSITPFDVILVPFPFSDLSQHKKRPCVVLAQIEPTGLNPLYIIAMITSYTRGHLFPYDYSIQDLKSAGLPKESLVRVSKVVTIEQAMVQKKLGTLSKQDQTQVAARFSKLFTKVLEVR